MAGKITLICKCGKSFNTTVESGNILCPSCRKTNNQKFKDIARFDNSLYVYDDSFKFSDLDVLKDNFDIKVDSQKSSNNSRKCVIQIRVSESEKVDLHRFSNLMNVDLSTLIRTVLLSQYKEKLKK